MKVQSIKTMQKPSIFRPVSCQKVKTSIGFITVYSYALCNADGKKLTDNELDAIQISGQLNY